MTDQQQPTAPATPAMPPEVYGVFAGMIDQLAVQRFHNAITICNQNAVDKIHILFQTAGGMIGDGISLYNLFQASPVQIALYSR